MPISRSSEPALLLPALIAVNGDYEIAPSEWRSIFSTSKSEMATEKAVTVSLLSPASIGAEGSIPDYDNNPGQRYTWNYSHLIIKKAFEITREAIADNLYKSEFNPMALGMKSAFETTRNVLAMAIFNNATRYNSAQVGDGQPLFSANHPYLGGTFPNVPTITLNTPSGPVNTAIHMDLSYTTIATGMTDIKSKFRLQNGMRAKFRAKHLLVGPTEETLAYTIWNSRLVPGTANNDANVLFDITERSLEQRILVDTYLDVPGQWQLLTDCPNSFIHLERDALQITSFVDPDTGSLKVNGYTRYLFGFKEPMGVYGSSPLLSA